VQQSDVGTHHEREASLKNLRRKRELIPRWEMPSDPVKAVFWFMHWFLRVLVRFFYILILGAVIYESIINGVVGSIGTLLVGLGVWGGLAALLLLFNFTSGVSRVVSEVNRVQRGYPPRQPFNNFTEPDGPVVEGTVTDLDEERKKRRQE
jgi:small-conductance mechanosensitive channel